MNITLVPTNGMEPAKAAIVGGNVQQGQDPAFICAACGTAEAVPCYKATVFCEMLELIG